jgi:hypothetical protein
MVVLLVVERRRDVSTVVLIFLAEAIDEDRRQGAEPFSQHFVT